MLDSSRSYMALTEIPPASLEGGVVGMWSSSGELLVHSNAVHVSVSSSARITQNL